MDEGLRNMTEMEWLGGEPANQTKSEEQKRECWIFYFLCPFHTTAIKPTPHKHGTAFSYPPSNTALTTRKTYPNSL